jgi:hypothetical protein
MTQWRRFNAMQSRLAAQKREVAAAKVATITLFDHGWVMLERGHRLIAAALNHVSIRSPQAATYNRSRYRPQVAAALQRLADALDGIEAGAAKVVRLRVGA